MSKIRIEYFGDYVELTKQGKLIVVEAGYDTCMTNANLPIPKAKELHQALGKMLGVEDKLLECCELALGALAIIFGGKDVPLGGTIKLPTEYADLMDKLEAAIKEAEGAK